MDFDSFLLNFTEFLLNCCYFLLSQAGDNLTVADISLVATVSSLDIASFDLSKYPNVVAWYEKCKATTPGYDINEEGLTHFKRFFE